MGGGSRAYNRWGLQHSCCQQLAVAPAAPYGTGAGCGPWAAPERFDGGWRAVQSCDILEERSCSESCAHVASLGGLERPDERLTTAHDILSCAGLCLMSLQRATIQRSVLPGRSAILLICCACARVFASLVRSCFHSEAVCRE